MLAHARDAVEFLADRDSAALETERMRRSAVIREAEVVGEAASKVAPDQRKFFPSIPWREASTFRNLLIHGYREIRTADLVDTIRNDFPPLIAELERILKSDPQENP
ncbi:MAG: DUF86 domain-containing protein [Hyphomonadaceae bacterium]